MVAHVLVTAWHTIRILQLIETIARIPSFDSALARSSTKLKDEHVGTVGLSAHGLNVSKIGMPRVALSLDAAVYPKVTRFREIAMLRYVQLSNIAAWFLVP